MTNMWYIAGSQDFQKLLASGDAPRNVARYYKFLGEQDKFKMVAKHLPEVKVAPGKEVGHVTVFIPRRCLCMFSYSPSSLVGLGATSGCLSS